MRHRSLGWIMMGAWLGVFPIAAHADYLSTARAALKKRLSWQSSIVSPFDDLRRGVTPQG
jgi:hypothetical protein